MAKKKGTPKKLRFEVFKRDSFTCQYCGRKAPDVILHVDHVVPESDGGPTTLLNLITSCRDCNLGKSDRHLSDNSVISAQQAQLAELQERREQLDMMVRWREGLRDIKSQTVDALADYWSGHIKPYVTNDTGRAHIRELLGKYDPDMIMQAMDTAADQYLVASQGGNGVERQSASDAFWKIRGICAVKSSPDSEARRRLYYIRGILRNRLSYINDGKCIPLLQRAVDNGMDLDTVQSIAKTASSWTAFCNALNEYFDVWD